jgi:NADH-quinone oxidoreductase subunit E
VSGAGEKETAGAPGKTAPPSLPEALPDALFEELRALTGRYPQKRGALLPILHALQERRGHLAPSDMKVAGELTGLSAAEVFSVVTFYTMYRQRPAGRFPLGVCRNIACWLRGSERLVGTIHAELGIGPGEATKDGLFSLEEVECLGSCGTAPCVEIEGRYFENLSPETLKSLIARLRAAAGDPGRAVLDAQAAMRPAVPAAAAT